MFPLLNFRSRTQDWGEGEVSKVPALSKKRKGIRKNAVIQTNDILMQYF